MTITERLRQLIARTREALRPAPRTVNIQKVEIIVDGGKYDPARVARLVAEQLERAHRPPQ